VRSNGSSQIDYIFGGTAAGGTAGFFGVWNMYNRMITKTTVRDATNSWTVPATTVRSLNNSTANRVSFIIGLQEDFASARIGYTSGPINTVPTGFAIGYDSTSVFSGVCAANYGTNTVPCWGEDSEQPLGFHFFQALDTNANSTGVSHYGHGGSSTYMQGGMTVELRN
jgi:hypothetical protein